MLLIAKTAYKYIRININPSLRFELITHTLLRLHIYAARQA